jgi:hypothetical protein
MDIKEIRKKYPQYNDLSDTQLADGLHKKHYSDIPREDFNAKIGLGPQGPIDKARAGLKKLVTDFDRETGVKDYSFRFGLGKADTLEEKRAYLDKKVGTGGYVPTNTHSDRSPDFALTESGLKRLGLSKHYKGKPISIDEEGATRYDIADASQSLLPTAAALGAGLFTGGLGAIPAMAIMGLAGGGARALEEGIEQYQGENLQSFGDVAKDVGRTGALEMAGEGVGRAVAMPLRYLAGPNMRKGGSIFGKQTPSASTVDPQNRKLFEASQKMGVTPNVGPATGKNPLAGFAQRLSHTISGGNPAAQKNLKALTGERTKIIDASLGDSKRIGSGKDMGKRMFDEARMTIDAFERDIVKRSNTVKSEVGKALGGVSKSFGKNANPQVIGDTIIDLKRSVSDTAGEKYAIPDQIMAGVKMKNVVPTAGLKAVAKSLLSRDIPGVKGLNDQAGTFLKSLQNMPDDITLAQAFKMSERLNKKSYNPDLFTQVGDFEARSIKEALDSGIDMAGHRIRGSGGQFLSTQKHAKAIQAYDDAKSFYKTEMGRLDTALVKNFGKQAKLGTINNKDVLSAIDNADSESIKGLFNVLGDKSNVIRKMHFNNVLSEAGVAGRKEFDPRKLRNVLDNLDKHGRLDAIYGKQANEMYRIAEQLDNFSAGSLPKSLMDDSNLLSALKNSLQATKDKRLLLQNDFVKILREGDSGAKYNDVVDMMVSPTGDAIEKIRHARTILSKDSFNQLRERAMWKMLSPLTKRGENSVEMVVDGQAINRLVDKIKNGNANPIIEMFGKDGPKMWTRIQQLGRIAEQTTQKGSNGLVAMNIALHPFRNIGTIAKINFIGKIMASPKYLDWMVNGWKIPKTRVATKAVGVGLTQSAAAMINDVLQDVKLGYEDEE